jgi:hypothetical protein
MTSLLPRCAVFGLVLAGGLVSVQGCSSDDSAAGSGTGTDGGSDGATSSPGTDASGGDASGGNDASADAGDAASDGDGDAGDAADGADASACDPSLPAVGSDLAGNATGTLAQLPAPPTSLPAATFTKAVYFPYPRDLASRWVVQLTDDPTPCTTLEAATVGNCVQTPAAYHYLGARFQADPVLASGTGNAGYSFNTGAGLYFSQGLGGTFQVDTQMDNVSGTVKGRVAICDSKTKAVVHATFSAVRCPNAVNMPCNQ